MSVRIYAIRNHTSDSVYVGSTERTLQLRFKDHRSSHRKWLKGKTNGCSSFQLLNDTSYIELLEECEVGVRYERERWWVENTPNCVNKLIPNRTEAEWKAEWYQQHKEEICARNKALYEANRDKIRAQQKEYYQRRKLKVSV